MANLTPQCEVPELKREKPVKYPIHKRPPVTIIILGACQHVLLALAGLTAIPLVVGDGICAPADDPIRTTLFSSTMFVSGLCTIFQTLVGVRLPIMQGPASGFIIVILAVKQTDSWQCQSLSDNSTIADGILSPNERLKELSGTIMVGSLIEILIGGTGLVGLLLRFIGPITVAPTITLIGYGLFKIPIGYSAPSWELALLGAVLMLVFSVYLGNVKFPLPTPSNCRKVCKKGEEVRGLRIFSIFPVLLSIMIVWGASALLTYTDVFPNDPSNLRYRARTDANIKLVERAPWFYFPYPGQFGMPTFNVGIFIGFIAVFIASMIESIGDYMAAGKACQVDIPPNHAMNRGIMMEGLGALVSGALGTGLATTSYTQNIAAMAHTRTGNRYVLVCAGMFMIIIAVIGKFGAALSTVPVPALAGAFAVICGMLVSMGLSTLQHVNLNSSRNLIIIGTALFFGIFISQWIDRSPGYFKTGNKEADNILLVVLGTPMFVGGFIAFVLDNTSPGSRQDRGIDAWKERSSLPHHDTPSASSTYSCICQPALDKFLPWLSKLPFMPSVESPDNGEIEAVEAQKEHQTNGCHQSRL